VIRITAACGDTEQVLAEVDAFAARPAPSWTTRYGAGRVIAW
jgi:hypothetical protein